MPIVMAILLSDMFAGSAARRRLQFSFWRIAAAFPRHHGLQGRGFQRQAAVVFSPVQKAEAEARDFRRRLGGVQQAKVEPPGSGGRQQRRLKR
jgi:hypothetical protein